MYTNTTATVIAGELPAHEDGASSDDNTLGCIHRIVAGHRLVTGSRDAFVVDEHRAAAIDDRSSVRRGLRKRADSRHMRRARVSGGVLGGRWLVVDGDRVAESIHERTAERHGCGCEHGPRRGGDEEVVGIDANDRVAEFGSWVAHDIYSSHGRPKAQGLGGDW